MAGFIKIDLENLQKTLQSLESSINEFESYTTTFRDGTRDKLKPMNSDFIEKMDALLDNMKNDINTDFIEKLNNIYEMGEAILVDIKETDEEIGKIIQGEA